jgi:hypothetical protein
MRPVLLHTQCVGGFTHHSLLTHRPLSKHPVFADGSVVLLFFSFEPVEYVRTDAGRYTAKKKGQKRKKKKWSHWGLNPGPMAY